MYRVQLPITFLLTIHCGMALTFQAEEETSQKDGSGQIL
ncbi:hypothetical protein LEP1GSC061_0802 [Leptospira wolffii serovar Khorat str. Khorat-H2]|nr:hypothetical protein LEP1GSC061_0802 [Leptospira wolffii serovar Khorat str. Khorat-H2]